MAKFEEIKSTDCGIHGLGPNEWFKIGVLIGQNVFSRLTGRELELLHEAEANEDLELPAEFWTSLLKNHSGYRTASWWRLLQWVRCVGR